MVGRTATQPLSIPESFSETLDECLELVKRDPLFIKSLEAKKTADGKKDKRFSPTRGNSLFSISVRFVIAEYVKRKRQAARASQQEQANLNPQPAVLENNTAAIINADTSAEETNGSTS